VDTQQAPSPSHIKIVKLTVSITQSQDRHIYGNPRGRGGTCGGISITDQITDHFAPHCNELENAAINEIRVLDEC